MQVWPCCFHVKPSSVDHQTVTSLSTSLACHRRLLVHKSFIFFITCVCLFQILYFSQIIILLLPLRSHAPSPFQDLVHDFPISVVFFDLPSIIKGSLLCPSMIESRDCLYYILFQYLQDKVYSKIFKYVYPFPTITPHPPTHTHTNMI